jgi:hypothetical protein
MEKVENLKKVTLYCRAGTTPDKMDLEIDPPEFEFIFGLAPEGMTAFEYQLAQKEQGQTISFPLKKEDVYDFFGPLQLPVRTLFTGGRGVVYLKVTITSVIAADNREIVRAMAEMLSHGGGGGCVGDCGCGCGG